MSVTQDTQAYKTITLSDRAAYVELQTAILDYSLSLARAMRERTQAGVETLDYQIAEMEATTRAMSAVMGAV